METQMPGSRRDSSGAVDDGPKTCLNCREWPGDDCAECFLKAQGVRSLFWQDYILTDDGPTSGDLVH